MIDEPVFPKFFIAGSQKCGTTALASYLDEHPLMAATIPKEPRYFSYEGKYAREKDYRQYIPRMENDNVNLFDSSTCYMYDEKAITRIKKQCDDVKFIFILRNPTDRAVSAYYHTLKHLTEKRSILDVFGRMPIDPEDVLEYETAHVKLAIKQGFIDIEEYKKKYDNYIWPFMYAYNGLYTKHIEKYQLSFGVDNVLVVTLNQIINEPKLIFDKICSFLELPNFRKYPDTQVPRNKTYVPKYVLNDTIRKNKFVLAGFQALYKIMSKFGKNQSMISTIPPVPDTILKKLNKLYEKEFEYIVCIESE